MRHAWRHRNFQLTARNEQTKTKNKNTAMDFQPHTAWEIFMENVWYFQCLIALCFLAFAVLLLAIHCVQYITCDTINMTKKIWLHLLYFAFYITYPIFAFIVAVFLETQNNNETGSLLFVFGLLLYAYIIYRHIFSYIKISKIENLNPT